MLFSTLASCLWTKLKRINACNSKISAASHRNAADIDETRTQLSEFSSFNWLWNIEFRRFVLLRVLAPCGPLTYLHSPLEIEVADPPPAQENHQLQDVLGPGRGVSYKQYAGLGWKSFDSTAKGGVFLHNIDLPEFFCLCLRPAEGVLQKHGTEAYGSAWLVSMKPPLFLILSSRSRTAWIPRKKHRGHSPQQSMPNTLSSACLRCPSYHCFGALNSNWLILVPLQDPWPYPLQPDERHQAGRLWSMPWPKDAIHSRRSSSEVQQMLWCQGRLCLQHRKKGRKTANK